MILTKKMTVEFLHPIYVGVELRAEGRIKERTGPREAVMEGLVYNKAEVLCARSEGSYALLEPKIAARLGMMGPQALEDIRRVFEA